MENFDSLIICRHLNTSLFSRGKRWHGTMFYGEWSIEDETAGGCINNTSTFYQNPQYLIRINKPNTDLVISLMQSDHRSEVGVDYITIGFICLRVEENRRYRIHKSTYEVVGRVTYINSREVTKRISLQRGQYILIPSTYNIGDEGEYFLRIFSSKVINIGLLKKDAPDKKWYYPILYLRRAYYVGMVRAQIISGSFNREVTKGYVKIIFFDLRKRIREVVISPKFNNSYEPDIDAEYLFYVRNPSAATLLFQLYESSTFGNDRLLGEVKIALGHYAKSSKAGRFWEVTKTMTRIIKAPPYMGRIKNEETETLNRNNNNDSYNGYNGDMISVDKRFIPKRIFSSTTNLNAQINEYDDGDGDVDEDDGDEDNNILRSLPNQGFVVTPVGKRKRDKGLLIPITVDAGIGELKLRIVYFQGVKN